MYKLKYFVKIHNIFNSQSIYLFTIMLFLEFL